MKLAKLSAVVLCALLIVLAIAVLPQRLCFKMGVSYTFYCGTSSKDCREITTASDAAKVRLALKDVCGESTVYENFDLDGFLKEVGGKIVKTEPYKDCVNYYCTADLPYSVNLNGQVINLHICVRENSAKVASPIIFGGY